jgi:hypothetical protein
MLFPNTKLLGDENHNPPKTNTQRERERTKRWRASCFFFSEDGDLGEKVTKTTYFSILLYTDPDTLPASFFLPFKMYFLFYKFELNSTSDWVSHPLRILLLSESDQKSFTGPKIEKTVILTYVASVLFIFGASRVLN